MKNGYQQKFCTNQNKPGVERNQNSTTGLRMKALQMTGMAKFKESSTKKRCEIQNKKVKRSDDKNISPSFRHYLGRMLQLLLSWFSAKNMKTANVTYHAIWLTTGQKSFKKCRWRITDLLIRRVKIFWRCRNQSQNGKFKSLSEG